MLFMTLYAYSIISVHKILNYGQIFLKSITYGRIDRRMNTPSYTDARTHLRTLLFHHCSPTTERCPIHRRENSMPHRGIFEWKKEVRVFAVRGRHRDFSFFLPRPWLWILICDSDCIQLQTISPDIFYIHTYLSRETRSNFPKQFRYNAT